MNRLFVSLLAASLVAGTSPAGALGNGPVLEVPSQRSPNVSTSSLASTPSLESLADVDEDIELNREADARLLDGQAPVPVNLSELV